MTLIHSKYIAHYVETLQHSLDHLSNVTDNYISLLDSTANILFSRQSHSPVHFSHEESSVLCKKLFPTELLNNPTSSRLVFPLFEKYFSSAVNESNDGAILQWKQNVRFDKLPYTNLKDLYLSLSQLNAKVIRRIAAYENIYPTKVSALSVA